MKRKGLAIAVLMLAAFLFPIIMIKAMPARAEERAGQPSISATNGSFAPYIMIEPSHQDSLDLLIQSVQQTGIKNYQLAFVTANGCQAVWGDSSVVGKTPDPLVATLNQLRKLGGDATITFGGAEGQELAQSCQDVNSLQQQYQKVIDTYHVTHLDFSIIAGDPTSNDRRNKALAALQKANPNVTISYTFPVTTQGLTDDKVQLLKNALDNQVQVDLVNSMAFDYGPSTQMPQDTLNIAQAVQKQIATLGLSTKLGVTTMIGHADNQGEILTLDDAKKLLDLVQQSNIVSQLSIWTIGRDKACPASTETSVASPICSGIAQQPFDFTKLFGGFTSSAQPVAPAVPSVPAFVSPSAIASGSPSATAAGAPGQPAQNPAPPAKAKKNQQPQWSFPCSDLSRQASAQGAGNKQNAGNPTKPAKKKAKNKKASQSRPAEAVIKSDWLSGDVPPNSDLAPGGHFAATYAADTYRLPLVSTLFAYMDGLGFLFITPSIILLGYQLMLGASSFRYAGALDGLSRVIFSATAIAVSFGLIQMLISLENSLTTAILFLHAEEPFRVAAVKGIRIPYTLPGEPRTSYRGIVMPMSRWGCTINNIIGLFSRKFIEKTLGSVIPLFGGLANLAENVKDIATIIQRIGQLVLAMLSFLLWIQVFARILFINFYILMAPLAFGCWALPGGVGQNVVRLWFRGFITILAIQVVQLFFVTTLPLLLPHVPHIPNAKMLQDILIAIPPILTLSVTLISPSLLGASMAKILSTASAMAGNAVNAVETSISRQS